MTTPTRTWIENSQTPDHGGKGWEFGDCLWSPTRDKRNASRWDLMLQPNPGDRVIHLRSVSGTTCFVGQSVVSAPPTTVDKAPPSPGKWAEMSPYYRVDLDSFEEFPNPLPLQAFLRGCQNAIHQDLRAYKGGHYPFHVVKKNNGLKLNEAYFFLCTEALWEIILGALDIPESTVQDWGILINGVQRDILEEIAMAQTGAPDLLLYLQPHSGSRIKELAKHFKSSSGRSIPLLLTTSDSINEVAYSCRITNWRDKTQLTPAEHNSIDATIREHQPSESEGLFGRAAIQSDTEPINLLEVKNMVRVQGFSITQLTRRSGGSLRERSRGGGHVYLASPPINLVPMKEPSGSHTEEFQEGETHKREAKFVKRNRRLIKEARKHYEAKCEACGLCLSDIYGEPANGFIEMHHRKPIMERDSTEAILTVHDLAPLCPNCHRIIHRLRDSTGLVPSVEEFARCLKS